MFESIRPRKKNPFMKSLFIVAPAPYPPTSGTPMRSWQNINILATRGPVHVLSVGGREPGDYTMPIVAEWVHLDNATFPAKGGVRSLLAKMLTQRQYSVPDVLATSAINKQLRAVIERVKPDIIVLSHWKHGYPTPLKQHDNVILDMHNIESLLGTDMKDVKSPFVRAILSWRWRARERTLIRNVSRTWVCGVNDAAELRRLDARLPAPIVWPNAIDLAYYADVWAGQTALPAGLQRNGATVIYVGFYSYEPNGAAATELIQKIAPMIFARISAARFIFVGGGPTTLMKDAAQRDSRIIVTGKVEDVRQYLALADLCVVPLRTGGGTRLKILECFAAKIPVISTPKGVEGIDAVAGRNIRIADSAEALAGDALELLFDADARRRQADAAYELVRRSYSWSSLAKQLDSALPPSASTTEPSLTHGV